MMVRVALKVEESKDEQEGKTEKKHHRHDRSVPIRLSRIRFMNDDVGHSCADGRNEPLRAKLPQRLSESLKLPFLFLLFFGYKRYAYTQKCYAEDSVLYLGCEHEKANKKLSNQ